MKRVAIVTITNSGMNFGNRIQNYALQVVLERYGVRAETIRSAKGFGGSLPLSRLRRFMKDILRRSRRRRYFSDFDRRHIHFSDWVRYENINERQFAERYDAYIAGSDQVWNPSFSFNSDFEFLSFTAPEKRYSYAASFGISEIPPEKQGRMGELLRDMREISVREEQGRTIVRELTGREAMVHVDPTMLLEASHYAEIEEKPPWPIPDRYFLVYFLGEITPDYQAFITALKERLALPVLELSELPDTPFYHIGPQHFLYLFRHADYICTDSFHGTLFSILFHKRFTVFHRKDRDLPMNSRIQTILEKMGLTSRLFGESPIDAAIEPIAYDQVEQRLEEERRKTFAYLEKIHSQW